MASHSERLTIAPGSENGMVAIILGLFVTVGIATLALVSYLFYLTPSHRDRLD
jgi:hypothetical protein